MTRAATQPLLIQKKKVFTSGQVAKICGAAPRTVGKWFDSGKLKGYKIPGSKDRRIPIECLVAFLRENKMPIPWELQESFFTFTDPTFASHFGETDCPSNVFDAGLLLGEKSYSHAIIQDFFGVEYVHSMAMRLHKRNPDCCVVVILDPSVSLDNFKHWPDGPLAAFHAPCSVEQVKAFFDDCKKLMEL